MKNSYSNSTTNIQVDFSDFLTQWNKIEKDYKKKLENIENTSQKKEDDVPPNYYSSMELSKITRFHISYINRKLKFFNVDFLILKRFDILGRIQYIPYYRLLKDDFNIIFKKK